MWMMEKIRLDPFFCLTCVLFLSCSTSVKAISAGQSSQSSARFHGTTKYCRDRGVVIPSILFRIHACSNCLQYLMRDESREFHVNVSNGFAVLQASSDGRIVLPDPGNRTAMDMICTTLDTVNCEDWKQCCQAAAECCQKQQSTFVTTPRLGDSVDDSEGCPMTWDGFSCVSKTPPGDTALIQCPAFIRRFTADINGKAKRQCLANSTWFTNSLGLEWTDYSFCHQVQEHQTILTLKLAFSGISLTFLVPSIAVFLVFRPLRSQLRIKLHINLFLALTLTAVFTLLWEILVSQDLLVAQKSQIFIKQHQVACKFLNIAFQCLVMATFSWMFCEGFYLTWLMMRSFTHLSSIVFLYVFGWGVPVLFSSIYIIVRITARDDNECWVSEIGGLQWIMDGPIVLCIATNLIFLVLIMRVMVCQLRPQHEDQSTTRRTLRALLILIPLFGLQQFCTLYRPKPSAPGFHVYEVVNAAISNLQGAVVALIFCFFNGEVQGHLKDWYRRLLYKLRGQRQQSRQSVSLTSSVLFRQTRTSMASIEASASVILTPSYLAARRTSSNMGQDDAGNGFGITDQHQDLESQSAPTNNGQVVMPVPTPGSSSSPFNKRYSTCGNDHLPGDMESTGDKSSNATVGHLADLREDRHLPVGSKKGLFPLLVKLSSKKRRSYQHASENSSASNCANTQSAQCNPDIMVSQYEDPDSVIVSSESNGIIVPPFTLDAVSCHLMFSDKSIPPASTDDNASSKHSFCGDDTETLRLVSSRGHKDHKIQQDDKNHNLYQHFTCHFSQARARLHAHHMTSANDDMRCLFEAKPLHESDSGASFCSILPSDADTDTNSVTTETEDSETSFRRVEQNIMSPEDAKSHCLGGMSFINAAFHEDN